MTRKEYEVFRLEVMGGEDAHLHLKHGGPIARERPATRGNIAYDRAYLRAWTRETERLRRIGE